MAANHQTLCLNMIVKNEAPVIARCLASARPIIDYWVIVDTGSTDGTQDAIRGSLADLPGELHERLWRDFAHNRTEAMDLARPHGDFVLIIDADDALEFGPQFTMPALQADSYMLRIADTSVSYHRTQIVRTALPWRWRGVLHEFLTCEDARTSGTLEGLRLRRNHDGARRRDPQTYRRDAEILDAALQAESDPFMRSRYQFYLAQSYRDCGESECTRIEANAAFARQKLGIDDLAAPAPSTVAAPRTDKLKIAVYTIALNEARHVDRWRSAANEADYLVVADTGSTDDTAERLSAAGVQVHRIGIHPWRFDDARDASLALVPADADVCISLDMDEYMMPGWRAAVESAWNSGATRLSYNFAPNHDGSGAAAHVIRKSKIHARRGYRWKRIIHEDLQPTDANEKHAETDAVLIGQIQDPTKDRSAATPACPTTLPLSPNQKCENGHYPFMPSPDFAYSSCAHDRCCSGS